MNDTNNKNQTMTEQARQARNEYARKWRARNKDKVQAINNRYWEKKAEEMAAEEMAAEEKC